MKHHALSAALALAVGLGPAPAVAAAPRESSTEPPPGHGLVVAGVVITIGSVAAYGVFGAGLGVGNRAERDLAAVSGREDIEARRQRLTRGRTGNRLAIAGGIAAAVMLATGLPLIVIGRRRATGGLSAARPRGRVSLGMQGAGAFVRIRL